MLFRLSFFKKALPKASPVILASLCFFIVSACSPKQDQRVYKLEGRTMGTSYHITAVVKPGVEITAGALQIEVDKRLENVNEVMSTYIADSELSLLNKVAANEPTIVSNELFSIIELSNHISDLSLGAFDVTVGPLVNLWGFGPNKSDQRPSDTAIAEAKARIGYHKIKLDHEKLELTKTADVYIDLSAIAKGYGSDAVALLFEQHKITDYMIEIGGEIAISGNNASGVGWRIGVEKPSLAQTGVIEAVSTAKGGIATSGDYRNYYEVDGVRYSHTIDPATGAPIVHKLASITVIAASAAEADGLATAINVLGPEKGYQMALRNNIAAFFVIRGEKDFVTKATPEFNQYVVKL